MWVMLRLCSVGHQMLPPLLSLQRCNAATAAASGCCWHNCIHVQDIMNLTRKSMHLSNAAIWQLTGDGAGAGERGAVTGAAGLGVGLLLLLISATSSCVNSCCSNAFDSLG
jgi:hypothetical protein